MDIEHIYEFFRRPQTTFLAPEPAVCYLLYVLLEGDSYGTELIRRLEKDYPGYKLSDTVFYNALQFLEEEQLIVKYWCRTPTRGRPRHMLKIQPDKQTVAQELAQFWQGYVTQRRPVLA